MLTEAGPSGHRNLFAGRPTTPPQLDDRQPVNFFHIESADPSRDFWVALARLLETLRAAAMRKAAKAR